MVHVFSREVRWFRQEPIYLVFVSSETDIRVFWQQAVSVSTEGVADDVGFGGLDPCGRLDLDNDDVAALYHLPHLPAGYLVC